MQDGGTIPKIYIYHCYGGSHSSVTAAAIHVGLLSREQLPSRQVLLSMPYFDTQKSLDHGVLQYVGTDEKENMVFSVGLETTSEQVIKALMNLLALTRAELLPVQFIGTMPTVNLWMKIGGICSRVFGLKGIGRPLVCHGTRLAFFDMVKLVDGVKDPKDKGMV